LGGRAAIPAKALFTVAGERFNPPTCGAKRLGLCYKREEQAGGDLEAALRQGLQRFRFDDTGALTGGGGGGGDDTGASDFSGQ
jgi:hypothetical protein